MGNYHQSTGLLNPLEPGVCPIKNKTTNITYYVVHNFKQLIKEKKLSYAVCYENLRASVKNIKSCERKFMYGVTTIKNIDWKVPIYIL